MRAFPRGRNPDAVHRPGRNNILHKSIIPTDIDGIRTGCIASPVMTNPNERTADWGLVHRDDDEQLLGARLVTTRRPGQWVSAAVLLLLFAMLVNTVITNGRFEWGTVGDY